MFRLSGAIVAQGPCPKFMIYQQAQAGAQEGPVQLPRPYIPWSCMGPMVSEDATEVDMKAVSHWQMAQNSLPIMLLLWAWLQCWSGMLFHGFQICQGSESIEHIMPMVVLVAGLVMTNVIGYVHFCQKGLWRDACLAAVDLDTPYLVYQHGRQIMLGIALTGSNCDCATPYGEVSRWHFESSWRFPRVKLLALGARLLWEPSLSSSHTPSLQWI